MKQFLFIVAFLLGMAAAADGASQWPVTGRVTDADGVAVEFANVVFMRDSVQVRGVASDADGDFSAELPAGRYRVRVQYLGYETAERDVTVEAAADCGTFVLRQQENMLEEVVVQTPLVRREADRFVVDVANAASAVGRDGAELLQQAPGVWISDDKIQINGKSGSKVYVNGRELRMDKTQLLVYLRSLQAADIQRIEVVPQSGSDHDADSSGGIILITLRRRRDDGMMGTVTFTTRQGRMGSVYQPNVSLNYHKNRLDLYTRIGAYYDNSSAESTEHTEYAEALLESASRMDERNGSGSISAGAIYELAERHSVGGEVEYNTSGDDMQTDSRSSYGRAGATTDSDSHYIHGSGRNHWSAMLNYIWKVDTLGSTFKILADYTRRDEHSHVDSRTQSLFAGEPSVPVRDSLYRDASSSDYSVLTVTAALEKRFTPRWLLRAGAKYTRNDLRNNALYEYLKDDEWVVNDLHTMHTDYAENIGAAYAAASASLGRWNVVAGLRGEYTAMLSADRTVDSRYFSLFPNANISCALDGKGSHMLIAQYSRTISRPGFSYMSPVRVQISEFSYIVGNPDLRPSFTNSMALSYVLMSKYTLSASASLSRGMFEQQTETDPSNPMVLRVIPRNFGRCDNYALTAVLPFTPTRWWRLNATLIYLYTRQNLPASTAMLCHHTWQAQFSTTFTLPRDFMIDVDYFGFNRVWLGNTSVGPMHNLSCSLKKLFFDKRLTASVSLDNILDNRHTVHIGSDDFSRVMHLRQMWNSRTVRIRLSYSFKAGKSFRNRSVESGAAEEKSRL